MPTGCEHGWWGDPRGGARALVSTKSLSQCAPCRSPSGPGRGPWGLAPTFGQNTAVLEREQKLRGGASSVVWPAAGTPSGHPRQAGRAAAKSMPAKTLSPAAARRSPLSPTPATPTLQSGKNLNPQAQPHLMIVSYAFFPCFLGPSPSPPAFHCLPA